MSAAQKDPQAETTFEEMSGSLTGFDEIAIEKHFDGFDIYADGERKGVRAMRALVFVHQTREGKPPKDAKDYAMGLGLNDVSAYFTEDPAAVLDDEDEPVSESGKGSEQPG